MSIESVGFLLLAFGIGVALGLIFTKKLAKDKMKVAEYTAKKVIEKAKKDAESVKKEAALQAKDDLYKAKGEFEKETRERRSELQKLERRLIQKEEHLDKKVDLLDQKEINISKREKNIIHHEKDILDKEKKFNKLIKDQTEQLERIAGISSDEAKRRLMKIMENDAKHESAKKIKRIEDETRETADKMAREIISLAVERYAADCVVERTVSVVNLPNDEMKGRIIGREGRNIRAIEAATGVDLIIDDTPEAVILSGYNPLRREVAKMSLERLINDGRIHPARIEEIVGKVQEEMETTIREAGEQATFDVGVHGIHSELIRLIGRLKFRTSFAQNVFQHSLEVAFICGILASELKVGIKQAKRAGLLHDIGKAVDHEVEGSHAIIGANLAKKYGESPEIVHAIAAHHSDEAPQTILAILVQAADSLSAARPGARREMLETYVKRLEDLERISDSFSGVNRSYAVQAGREVRIIVESSEISDEDSIMLARDIAKKIENELSYPGQIKITVIRETRAIEFAK
ncbi:MAG: ribonuclease Y [Thermodesulfobacteriota bacterium]|nr:ribonuclease Y [Thermodesulfobacteriota bacterium]